MKKHKILSKDVLNQVLIKDQSKNSNVVRKVKILSVIEIMATIGDGTHDNPRRVVVQYWDFKGNLLAINDPVNDVQFV
jgi:hypothetical protein